MIRIASLIAVAAVVAACSSRTTEGTTGTPDPQGDVSAVNPSLTGTHWTLVAIGTTPLAAGATQREPFVTLDGAEQRLSGSNGCNIIFGSYTLRGDAIGFSAIGATKMACAKGMEIETAFHDALSATVRYRIANRRLELMNAAGATTARFEAPAVK
jgi:heat shock protein HslJ